MSKDEYVRCPRCELNYIKKKDKLCKVCQQELDNQVSKNISDEEARELGLCPICKTNYLMEEETICPECEKEKEAQEQMEIVNNSDSFDTEDDDGWRAYVENDDSDGDDFGGMASAYKDAGLEDDDDMEIVEDDEDDLEDDEEPEDEEEFDDDDIDDAIDDDLDEYDDDEYDDDDDDEDDE